MAQEEQEELAILRQRRAQDAAFQREAERMRIAAIQIQQLQQRRRPRAPPNPPPVPANLPAPAARRPRRR